LAWPLKTSSMMCAPRIAAMMDAAQSWPGSTSRGAIQQRIPLASKAARAASAVCLSWLE
jgi:hypothetical protein